MPGGLVQAFDDNTIPQLWTAEDAAADPLEQCFEQHSAALYRHVVLLGLDPQSAEDIIQETFLRLHLAMKKGTRIESVRHWLLKVGTNLALNFLRDGKARRLLTGDPAAEILERARASGRNAEQIVLAGERAQSLARAMEQLSPQQRACIHLRAEGLRYREIASALGVGVSTVEEFLSRAIARLRASLT